MASKVERILILAKTYPSPSAKHTETSCVAGINEHGQMRRLYPVPFRMIAENQQFQKWQWVTLRIEKSPADHRPESHKVFVDTIQTGETIPPEKGWALRRQWWKKMPTFASFDALEQARQTQQVSLALLRPKRIERLEITAVDNPEWTDEELTKLSQEQSQGNLFSEDEQRKQLKLLEKMPFDFHYHYLCDTPDGERAYRHKIVDWEVAMLFRNCRKSHVDGWETPFRAKLEREFAARDLMFMMGNIHRFQHQWLIISLIYPPKPAPGDAAQGCLF
jgi:hypothetical protein